MLSKSGTITSASMKDTVTVTVHRRVMHPLYKKSFRSSKKFLVDSKGIEDIQIGDEVRIEECRPISSRKHFRISEVIKRVPRVSEMTEEKDIGDAIHRQKEELKEEKLEKEAKDIDHSSKSSTSAKSASADEDGSKSSHSTSSSDQ